ncbi:MAG: STAS domain-containing protein [Actinomycetota bacterium]
MRPPPGPEPIVCDVSGLVHPDVRSIDVLARLQLMARRAGRRMQLRRACPQLCELIELAGLSDALPLRVEPLGEAEEREEVRRIEEEGDAGELVPPDVEDLD